MKRSKTQLLRNLAVAMIACAGLASCSQDDLADNRQGEPLPPGEYPLILNAGGLEAIATPAQQSAPTTRGTVDGNWDGVESVAVMVNGVVKEYKVTPSDTEKKTARLKVKDGGTPFYWQNTADLAVEAWWPFTGSDGNLSDKKPAVVVQADQNNNNGYAKSDFIEASADVQFYNPTLTFTHRTAKVVVALTWGNGFTDEEKNSAEISLINLNTQNGNPGTISPLADKEKITYTALLAPQTIVNGRQFISIKIADDKIFYYTQENSNTLQGGTQYIYQIEVKKTGVEFGGCTISDWSDDRWKNGIEARLPLGDITDPAQAKRGDLALADGSFVSNAEIDNLTADQKAACVGIVFWTEEEAGNATLKSDKVLQRDYPHCTHGLILALTMEPYKWPRNKEDDYYYSVAQFQADPISDSYLEGNKTDYASISAPTKEDNDNDNDNRNLILGYNNTEVLKAFETYRNDNGEREIPINAVGYLASFASTTPAPRNASSWYIPSIKEVSMLWLGDEGDDVQKDFGKIMMEQFPKLNELDALLKKVKGIPLKVTEKAPYHLFSSSETPDNKAWEINYRWEDWYCGVFEKGINSHNAAFVRPVCAF